eukprot:NODE_5453_length_508_cov_122.906318_g4061_i0.p2 GENE.NODE_5453_length_508_cov_122.906318_g4061_i0~~NODE_5453_length_508_cov_122.906318_g4061_i0.p2  ORF type:complete len:116 (-),score=53.57 NODE_5453_length_508_cov_122.906318_g4061_i0:130-477(-)
MGSPEFQHHQEFPVCCSVPFLSYITAASLPIVVVNDLDEEDDHYMGMAQVPLKSLLDGPEARVHGTFPLLDAAGQPAGAVALALAWTTDDTLRAAIALDDELEALQRQQQQQPQS